MSNFFSDTTANQNVDSRSQGATDRWRASRMPKIQLASSLSPARSVYRNNSRGSESNGQFPEDPAARSQSFMPSEVQSSHDMYSVQSESLSSQVGHVGNGQGVNFVPADWAYSPNMGAGLSEDGQARRLRNSSRALFAADSQSFAGSQILNRQGIDAKRKPTWESASRRTGYGLRRCRQQLEHELPYSRRFSLWRLCGREHWAP